MTDAKLLRLLRKSPADGMRVLIDTYLSLVAYIVKGKLQTAGSAEDIEDCISEVFASFYEQIGKIKPELGGVKAYLCAIAKRKAVDYYRLKQRETGRVPLDDEITGNRAGADRLEDAFLLQEDRRALLQAVKSLGEPDNEIIIRKYFWEESSKEIAARLGMTVSAVDTRSFRAVRKLRKILGGNGDE